MSLDELIESMKALELENRAVSVFFLSSAYFTELTRIIPLREAKPKEATGLQFMGIPVYIDNLSGYKLIAVDQHGFPSMTVK